MNKTNKKNKEINKTPTKADTSYYGQLKRNRDAFLKTRLVWEERLKNNLKDLEQLKSQNGKRTIFGTKKLMRLIIGYMEWDETTLRMMKGETIIYSHAKFKREAEQKLRKKYTIPDYIPLLYK